MNQSDIVKLLHSPVITTLADEANHNPEAMDLLEMIHTSVESLIFFKERNIESRIQLETLQLQKIINYLNEIY
jgi:tRNA G26 N,N-dimethylase Trm1